MDTTWSQLLDRVRKRHGLYEWSILPESIFPEIAAECGTEERQEVRRLLAMLDEQEASVPDWDGDTKDDIWRARRLFRAILAASDSPEA